MSTGRLCEESIGDPAPPREFRVAFFRSHPNRGVCFAAALGVAGCGEPASAGSTNTASAGSSADAAYAGTTADGGDNGFSSDAAASPVVVLASGQAEPSGIAVDDSNVYWINSGQQQTTLVVAASDAKRLLTPILPPVPNSINGEIMRCAIRGCGGAPTALATGLTSLPESTPVPLVVADGNIYWNDLLPDSGASRFIQQVATAANDSVPTSLTPGFVWAMASDGQNLYWTTNYGVTVMACSLAGCGDTPLTLWSDLATSPDQLTSGIAVDDEDVYWATQAGEIFKCAKPDCQSALLVASGPVTAAQIAIDDLNVYWTTSQPLGLGQILKCPKTGCGNSPTTLVSGLSVAYGIATDGTSVYWAELGDSSCCDGSAGTGRIAKCAAGGCNDQPTTLADGLTQPSGIAVDANNVYWTTMGMGADAGQVLMMAK